jgi:translation elongation factor EF-4
MEKLVLNDSALSVETEVSPAFEIDIDVDFYDYFILIL